MLSICPLSTLRNQTIPKRIVKTKWILKRRWYCLVVSYKSCKDPAQSFNYLFCLIEISTKDGLNFPYFRMLFLFIKKAVQDFHLDAHICTSARAYACRLYERERETKTSVRDLCIERYLVARNCSRSRSRGIWKFPRLEVWKERVHILQKYCSLEYAL